MGSGVTTALDVVFTCCICLLVLSPVIADADYTRLCFDRQACGTLGYTGVTIYEYDPATGERGAAAGTGECFPANSASEFGTQCLSCGSGCGMTGGCPGYTRNGEFQCDGKPANCGKNP